MSIFELLFGKRLRSEEEQREQLSTVSAIPAVGLDALASAAYGPEAALTVLLLGHLGSAYILPITGSIIFLLFLVALSYRQTIPAYPNGGGSFTVAKENLGLLPGLLAGTSLCIDYVLNVAVAISAGVGALVSAAPPLQPYTLHFCLGILLLLTALNLRGVRSAGMMLLLPTYLFIFCLGLAIVLGTVKLFAAHGRPVPVQPLPVIPATGAHAAGIWLLLRAFASGCTALTGIEAISNAVPIFREPSTVRAKRTLTLILAILGCLLAGIAGMVQAYGITATPPGKPGYQNVLSQILSAVAGRGLLYYTSISSIFAVLLLSANTSFTGFPGVCRLLALDDFLPAEFAHRGRRLVYSTGIVALAVLSAILLVAFGGVTDRLIPLFAVGAFSAFTLSQLGMVFHWKRSGGKHALHSMVLNGIGAVATGATLIIIAAAKFTQGAWLTIVVMPLSLVAFFRIRRYNQAIEQEVEEGPGPLDVQDLPPPIVVVPLKRLNRVTRKALRFAVSFGVDVYAVQVVAEEAHTEDLARMWRTLVEEPARRSGCTVPKLVIVKSPYREFFGPLIEHINKLSARSPQRPIAVVIPELVEKRWYNFLFRHRATLLKELLLLHGGPQILVISAPWYLGQTQGEP